jgi:outer membrane lipoprotein carrier protein
MPGGLSVARLWGVVLVLTVQVFAQDATSELTRLVDGLNDRLATTGNLSADFVQVVEFLNQTTREEGHVYLSAPNRSRWEYDSPTRKLVVTDGEIATEYTPAENFARRRRMEDGEAGLMPLVSVLGRRNLREEFQQFELLSGPPRVEGTRVIRAYPRRESDIEQIVIEADPETFIIRRLLVIRRSQRNDLVFNNVLTNVGMSEGLFSFDPPPGTDLVDRVN